MHATILFSGFILSSHIPIEFRNVRIWRPVYYSNNYTLLFSNMIFVNLYEDRFDRVILVANVISTKILYIVLNENRDSSSCSGWSVFMYRIVTRQAIYLSALWSFSHDSEIPTIVNLWFRVAR